jgi:peptidoglycan/LPS O-acetylase OafA/YrhL
LREGYRPDIDGLRAFAVIAVLLFHAGVAPFQGGFVGVDIFFVISGYLITGIIVGELEQGKFSLARFYERRARRILPALMVMIVVVLIVSSLFLIPGTFKSVGGSAAAAVLSVSNLYFWRTHEGYFDLSAAQAPLLHTWSLGVEEQFYIFYPLYLMFARRFTRFSWRAIIGFILIVSFGCNLALMQLSQNAAFYLPVGRTWELALGGLLSVNGIPQIGNRRWREVCTLSGLALLLGSIFLLHEDMAFPGWAALAPCAGAALLIYSGRSTAVGATLAWRPIAFIGLISYSLYLWHWPILVLAGSLLGRQPTALEGVALLALGLGVSVLSWRFVEQPARKRVMFPTRSAMFTASGVSIACLAAIGAFVWSAQGLPERFRPPVRVFAMGAEDFHPKRGACGVRLDSLAEPCVVGAEATQPSIAVIGDSFADAFVPGIAEAAAERGDSAALYIIGCLPLMGVGEDYAGCSALTDAVARKIAASPEIRTILLVGRWTAFVEGTRFGALRSRTQFYTDDETAAPSLEENQRVFARSLRRSLEALGGRQIHIVAYWPEQPVLAPQAATSRALLGLDPSRGLSREDFDRRQARVREVLDAIAMPNVHVLDASEYLCNDLECPVVTDGSANYFDDNHVSRTAAVRIRGLLAPALEDAPRPIINAGADMPPVKDGAAVLDIDAAAPD